MPEIDDYEESQKIQFDTGRAIQRARLALAKRLEASATDGDAEFVRLLAEALKLTECRP